MTDLRTHAERVMQRDLTSFIDALWHVEPIRILPKQCAEIPDPLLASRAVTEGGQASSPSLSAHQSLGHEP